MIMMVSVFLFACMVQSAVAECNFAYEIDATDTTLQSDTTMQSVARNSVVLGSESINADYAKNLHVSSSSVADSHSFSLNSTFEASASQHHIISSHSFSQNLFACQRVNTSFDSATSGFFATGTDLNLDSEAIVSPTELLHGVSGEIAGESGIGFVSQSDSDLFRHVVRSRARVQNISMLAEWHSGYPGAPVQNNFTDISRLCVWQTQPVYPLLFK